MPLPGGVVPLSPSNSAPPPSFLVRFPEETWSRLSAAAANGDEVSLTVDGGVLLNLPDQDSIPLETQPSAPTELYTYNSGALGMLGTANARLGVPFTAASTTRVAAKVAQTNAALDRQRQARADRVVGKPTKPVSSGSSSYQPPPSAAASLNSLPMGRTMSGPSAITLATTERIPLKTRIVQLLALGPATMDEILTRTGGNPDDVMRAVKVIGQLNTGKYRLRPPQYAKIKIGQWKYTYDEKVKVIELARKAFDELGLPPDAEERDELDKKAREALEGGAPGSSSGSAPATPPEPPAPPPVVASPAKKKKEKEEKKEEEREKPPKADKAEKIDRAERTDSRERNESPAPRTKKEPKVERTKVGKQIAKMRQSFAQRSSSLPNSRGAEGTASPRLGPSGSPDDDVPEVKLEKKETKKDKEKREREKDKERGKEKPISNGTRKGGVDMKKRNSRDYTSSEDSDSDDGRRGRTKRVATNATNGKTKAANGRKKEANYTSSEDESSRSKKERERERERERAERERERQEKEREREREREQRDRERELERQEKDKERERLQREKDKEVGEIIEDRPLKRKAEKSNGSRRTPSLVAPNAKAMRERYAEIYPLYESLSASLATVFQSAERVRDGASPTPALSEADVASKIQKYEEYHKELEGIRAWFAPK